MDQTELTFDRLISGTRTAIDVVSPGVPFPHVTTEDYAAREIGALEADWRLLELRAAEANVFNSPDFLIAACQHFPQGMAPDFIAVWKHSPNATTRTLIGLFPVHKTRRDLPGAALRAWTHPFVALGTPLVDRTEAETALNAAIAHMATRYSDLSALLLSGIAAHGPLAAALARVAAMRKLERTTLASASRAELRAAPLRSDETPKHGKELRRLRRRLGEAGSLAFTVAETYAEIRTATETFLALEASGWKGARGTALVQDPDHANFVRTMLWSAARQGRVRIAEIKLDGVTIASTVLLMAGKRGFLWKIAYAEAFAKFSPGVLLVEDVSRWMQQSGIVTSIDSCAHEGHRMIESLWSERIEIVDVMVALRPGRTPGYLAGVARERLSRSLRARLKSAYLSLRGRN